MGVVGLGRIGRALAQKARGVGMSVIGSSRSGAPVTGVDRVYGTEGLEGLLAASDHVVITVPLTRETRNLIGARELAAMKPTAYLYNVGRGPVVETDALVAALRDGEIAGAGLDVTDPEPLPPDHALWSAPNTIVLTHYAGLTPRYGARAYAIVRENVRRFLAGQPLLNVVEKERGY